MRKKRFFLSYHFDPPGAGPRNTWLVHRVNYYLNKQRGVESFCFAPERESEEKDWMLAVQDALDAADCFVLFAARTVGKMQFEEVEWFSLKGNDPSRRSLVIRLQDAPSALSADSLAWSAGKEDLSEMFDRDPHAVCCKLLDENASASAWEQAYLAGDTLSPATDMKSVSAESPESAEELQRHEEVQEFERAAQECAQHIYESYFAGNGPKWLDPDGLPIGYPFDYEKTIIEHFVSGNGEILEPGLLQKGCPIQWPRVKRIREGKRKFENWGIAKGDIGVPREANRSIIVDARSMYHNPHPEEGCPHCLSERRLTFPEAGPRKQLCHPVEGRRLTVGIVVSGGIAPGINAVITGIWKRHRLYYQSTREKKDWYDCDFVLYRDGFSGLVERRQARYRMQSKEEAEDCGRLILEWRNLGGSMISTSRYDDLLTISDPEKRKEALDTLVDRIVGDDINILYVIGGEGTMRAAHTLACRLAQEDPKTAVVAIPKTMDNDILWVWQSFGFLSAVEKAKEFVQQLHTESRSNPRLCVVQLFGSDSGFVVSHTALGSGVCQAAVIPEVDFTMHALSCNVRERLLADYEAAAGNGQAGLARGQSPYGIILLAETAVPHDIEDYIDNPDYGDLGLEDEEKARLREFVGSALLGVEDLPEKMPATATPAPRETEKAGRGAWLEFWERVEQRVEKTGSLPLQTLQSVVRQATDKGVPHTPEMKRLFVRSLNGHIREHDFFLEIVDNKAYPPGLASFCSLVDGCLALVRNWNPETKKLLRRLRSYPLQHEACFILQKLAELPAPKKEKDKCDPVVVLRSRLVLRLRDRLVELRNRLLLEAQFPKLFRARSVRTERRVFGQTPDKLRTGVLKVVSRVLQADLRSEDKRTGIRPVMVIKGDVPPEKRENSFWEKYRVFTSEPRHLLRAIDPSVQDIIFGQRLGTLAVDNAMAGYSDFMVSQWLTEYVLVPLELVVLGRKRVPHTGIFWQSVRASTGQTANLAEFPEAGSASPGTE